MAREDLAIGRTRMQDVPAKPADTPAQQEMLEGLGTAKENGLLS
jgi:hypothetical protein